MMVDSNDGSHGDGPSYASIRKRKVVDYYARTDGRPKSIVLHHPFFRKHNIENPTIINLV